MDDLVEEDFLVEEGSLVKEGSMMFEGSFLEVDSLMGRGGTQKIELLMGKYVLHWIRRFSLRCQLRSAWMNLGGFELVQGRGLALKLH